MIEIASFEARTHFSDLLRRVAGGEDFIVTTKGKPVAYLTRPRGKPDTRKIDLLLTELDSFRTEIAARGPVLHSGESWKELARDGMKW